ncbi:ArsR/SmtB family transcription factor [Mucilaginibacter sp. SP1R1]|uniref:ArsR/SmtB family transcription factor n=1 Tax=Mucilaginibacter sp. SP1R1 TaxID=2723091 RepID=UPI00161BFF9A|nr:winged helix-turn-helix domain-containing protein [Mucilaginibacter sp. SP1R1]MBB6151668.1 DNA-binding transcriptional ArsR family regulator [Mucilaginibacter sp. SP1R1]
MTNLNSFKQAATLFGEPARAAMIWELFEGKPVTASELAMAANITPQSASSHLKKLVEAGILTVSKQGKYKYFVYARPEIAVAVETLANVFSAPRELSRTQKQVRAARSCYDHLAGQAGVQVTEAFLAKGFIADHPTQPREFAVTAEGLDWFGTLGINTGQLQTAKRPLALKCIDWTEKRPHLAGSLGAALLQCYLKEGWFRKVYQKRSLQLTSKGEAEFKRLLNIDVKP